MVILDVDHPDVEEFIWCKANEEKKARVLRDAGFDMDLDGKDITSIQYQNANNSVRISDEFMHAVINDSDWNLMSRDGKTVIRTVKAKELWRQIARAAWECADPGLQFDTTINAWHTSSNTDRINGSNPCSEYMHIDNSACNLASLNLMKFLLSDGRFDVDAFKASIEVLFTAQEIIVGAADYPTEKIGENSRKFRQLGIGYANLGALLMASGMAYDSDEGRALAASISALMTGHAYATSARTAGRMGPHEGFAENAEPMLNVLRKHRAASYEIANLEDKFFDVLFAAQSSWDDAVELGEKYGVRNAQASVLAPTGTIGLLMDCDTTGVEPDLGLVKFKKLVGGGNMSIVNQTVPRALRKLGYSDAEVDAIIAYIDVNKSIVGAPELRPEHLPVFACSMGDNTIHYLGHVKMMGAIQPFISGAISKTVNMPEEATIEDVANLHMDAWKLGIKAVAIYRDNCKVGQPLSTAKKDGESTNSPVATDSVAEELKTKIAELELALSTATTPVTYQESVVVGAVRERLPRRRVSTTFSFRVADCEGYVTVGEYEDGRPGEVFIKVSKQGSTLAGIMDAFSISISLGLQHGVPLATYVRKYVNMKFEPSGMTDDADLRIATSIVDYIFRRLALDYLSPSEREDLGVLSTSERLQPTLPEVVEQATPSVGMNIQPTLIDLTDKAATESAPLPRVEQRDAPMCYQCGNSMQRAGSCYVCSSCGATSGCS
jgi:ribonucleoside-diphosphate reductase alpha chain